MITELKIGPILTVCNRDTYLPNMVDAFLADNERGSHHLNNESAEKLKQEWPTMIEMANLIETQRDLLLAALKDASNHYLTNAKAVIDLVEQGKCQQP